MSSDSQVLSQIVMLVGSVTAILAFVYSIYKIAKRVEDAIGVDEEGRTLSERMDKVEYQLWPNSGKSMADRVNSIDRTNNQVVTEVKIIKELLLVMVEANQAKSTKNKKNIG